MPHPLVPFSRFLPRAGFRTAAALLALACGLAAGAAQAQDVYINGTVGGAIAPGVYGQINFGSRPPPPVLYAQPMLIQRGPIAEPPLYLYVPPGHSKNWRRYCGRYNACGRPVYFVQVNERNRWWAPPHGGPRPDHDRRDERGDRGDGPRHGRGHDDHGRGNDRNDHGRDDRGPGRGGPGHRQFDN
ncbi:hypothetical protein [Rhodoferax sp.]|uniref:hypothetical protein n=1 Tax=Rhodoferax sp. TaxID=50421 RepID=UPI0025E5B484|nr:hypothetical protein [Rhodoferax sp.]